MPKRILYTGQQYDQETGQYYLRARYYNPVVGRFLQEDTYRGDGLNLYAYCANNPVVYYDPSGHLANNCPEDPVVKPDNTQAGKKNTGPNPNGRKGGEAHRKVIDDIKKDADRRGLEYSTEKKFNTPGGYKNSRYADVVVYDSKGRIMEIHQVGRTTTRHGAPVSRERKAIRDIRSSKDYTGVPIIYHPYDTLKD